MARAQIGNPIGVAAVDTGAKIAEITADGVNTVTVSLADARKLRPGQTIDLLTKSSGAVIASARTVDQINVATGVITYSGADVTAVPGTTAVYDSGDYEAASPAIDTKTNLNGGSGDGSGMLLLPLNTIDGMRDRLKAIAVGTYTDAYLDLMTFNDMVYAIRLNDAAGSIK